MNLMKRAAQIRRASGNRIKMTDAVKKAAAENRAKKKKPAKKAVRRAVKKSAPRKRARSAAVPGRSKRKATTVASATGAARRILIADIGSLEARKFTAKLKRDKNKLAKKISEKKALYRKLS